MPPPTPLAQEESSPAINATPVPAAKPPAKPSADPARDFQKPRPASAAAPPSRAMVAKCPEMARTSSSLVGQTTRGLVVASRIPERALTTLNRIDPPSSRFRRVLPPPRGSSEERPCRAAAFPRRPGSRQPEFAVPAKPPRQHAPAVSPPDRRPRVAGEVGQGARTVKGRRERGRATLRSSHRRRNCRARGPGLPGNIGGEWGERQREEKNRLAWMNHGHGRLLRSGRSPLSGNGCDSGYDRTRRRLRKVWFTGSSSTQ